MSVGSRTPHCRTVFQNWQDKTPRASPDEQSVMEYPPELPQDTKSLRSCSGNREKMLLKGQLRIKCHSQYIKIVRLLQHNGSGWGCILRDLETIIVLVLLAFNFIPQRSHHAFTLTSVGVTTLRVSPYVRVKCVSDRGSAHSKLILRIEGLCIWRGMKQWLSEDQQYILELKQWN